MDIISANVVNTVPINSHSKNVRSKTDSTFCIQFHKWSYYY